MCLTNPSWSLTPVLHIQKTEGVGEDNLSSRDQENNWEKDRERDKQPFTYFSEIGGDTLGSLVLKTVQGKSRKESLRHFCNTRQHIYVYISVAGKDNSIYMLLSTESFSCKQKGLLLQVLTAWYIKVLACVTQHFLNKGNFEGQSICFTVARLGQLLLRAQKSSAKVSTNKSLYTFRQYESRHGLFSKPNNTV